MKLSTIQYDVMMQAINNAKAEVIDQTFIDPYSEYTNPYSNEEIKKALSDIEIKLIRENI